MKGKSFFELYGTKADIRCLDLYNAHPEKDAVVLVGILAGLLSNTKNLKTLVLTVFFLGLLIGIPVILFLVYAYQRRCFSLFDNSPAAFSRQFYTRTRSGEEFY